MSGSLVLGSLGSSTLQWKHTHTAGLALTGYVPFLPLLMKGFSSSDFASFCL